VRFFCSKQRRQLDHNEFVGNSLFHIMKVEFEDGVDLTKKGVCCFRPVLSEMTPGLDCNSRGALID
jgi:hypothetical protein